VIEVASAIEYDFDYASAGTAFGNQLTDLHARGAVSNTTLTMPALEQRLAIN